MPTPENFVCTNCNAVAVPKKKVPGNLGFEVLLYFFALIPGLAYTYWRGSNAYKVCPICDAKHPVPTDTPAGKRILAQG